MLTGAAVATIYVADKVPSLEVNRLVEYLQRPSVPNLSCGHCVKRVSVDEASLVH